jgi:excisionase family DNA binding protein
MTGFQIDLPDALLEQFAQRVAAILQVQQETTCSRPGLSGSPGRWLTVAEAAEYLRCAPQRIYDHRSSGRLTRHGDGARALVDRHELDHLIEGGTR